MRKILFAAAFVLAATSAQAAHGHHGGHHGHHHGWGGGGWYGGGIYVDPFPSVVVSPQPSVVYANPPQTVVVQNAPGIDVNWCAANPDACRNVCRGNPQVRCPITFAN